MSTVRFSNSTFLCKMQRFARFCVKMKIFSDLHGSSILFTWGNLSHVSRLIRMPIDDLGAVVKDGIEKRRFDEIFDLFPKQNGQILKLYQFIKGHNSLIIPWIVVKFTQIVSNMMFFTFSSLTCIEMLIYLWDICNFSKNNGGHLGFWRFDKNAEGLTSGTHRIWNQQWKLS